MGAHVSMEYIPKTQIYHNIFSSKKFKDVLAFCCEYKIAKDAHLVEQILMGALAATEFDCIADLENEALDVNLTKEHYKQYISIANDVMQETGSNKEEVRSFIRRMENYCKTTEDQMAFLE